MYLPVSNSHLNLSAVCPDRHAFVLHQVLWLYNDEVTEVGTMNVLCYWLNEDGEKEVVTAPLDGTILPGVTRDTVIYMLREWGINVVERTYTMTDVAKAVKENRVCVCVLQKRRYKSCFKNLCML